jgi:hypothetical protein
MCLQCSRLRKSNICGSFAKITLHFLVFFLSNNPTITSYKRRNHELSNKVVTDFEIAKTLLDFPSFSF